MPHILLPTDFSEASLNAVRFALSLFEPGHSRLTLVHVYQNPVNDNALVPDMGPMVYEQAAAAMRDFERSCTTLPGAAGFSRIVAAGWLPSFLNILVEDEHVDIVIMGLHGGGNALIGTMATAVVKKTQVPVLLVPKECSPTKIERILLAHDGSLVDRATLRPLIALAERFKAQLIVAHVRDNIATLDEPKDREMISLALTGVPHTFVTVQGESVANTIDELARTGRIQLVAAVHRKRGFWKGLLHRSKTRRMALHTHLPLMVLPTQDAQK